MIFKSRNVCRTQADRGVSSEPQTCQMGVVAGHLKTGGNQALGGTSHAARLVRATFADGTERPAAKRSKAERAQARLRLLRHPGRDSWRARSPTPADVPAQLFRPWICATSSPCPFSRPSTSYGVSGSVPILMVQAPALLAFRMYPCVPPEPTPEQTSNVRTRGR